MSEKRMSIILNYMKSKNDVTLSELCTLFPDFNKMTLRRDLITLEKNGYVRRVRGGAVLSENSLTEYFNYSIRSTANIEEKRYIAVRAAEQLYESSSVYFDAGTTVLELARMLRDIPLFITTNMPTISVELLKSKNIDVFLTGGSLNKSVVSLSGPIALATLDSINIDTAFIGAAGFSLEHGFSNALYNECELKKKAIAAAGKTIVLIDGTKVGKSLPFTFAALADVDTIITDKPLPARLKAAADEAGVEVIC